MIREVVGLILFDRAVSTMKVINAVLRTKQGNWSSDTQMIPFFLKAPKK